MPHHLYATATARRYIDCHTGFRRAKRYGWKIGGISNPFGQSHHGNNELNFNNKVIFSETFSLDLFLIIFAIYCSTSGFLLRCLTGSKQGDVYKNLTHLILDEVHEREKVTDFLLIAIRDAIQTNPHLKVILMSATLDSEQFSKYFNNCPVSNFKQLI